MKIPEKSFPAWEFQSLCCLNGFAKRKRSRSTNLHQCSWRNEYLAFVLSTVEPPFPKKNPFFLRAVFCVPKIVNSIDPYLGERWCELLEYKFNGASTGFEPMASALALKCFTNWAMKTHTLEAGQFFWVHSNPWKEWNTFLLLPLWYGLLCDGNSTNLLDFFRPVFKQYTWILLLFREKALLVERTRSSYLPTVTLVSAKCRMRFNWRRSGRTLFLFK